MERCVNVATIRNYVGFKSVFSQLQREAHFGAIAAVAGVTHAEASLFLTGIKKGRAIGLHRLAARLRRSVDGGADQGFKARPKTHFRAGP